MKRYIRSATKVTHNAKDAAKLVMQYLTDLGIQNIFTDTARKAGYTGTEIGFTILYDFMMTLL